MLNILRSMYGQASSRVTLNSDTSEEFLYRKGVRQGCNLSPLLFSLFIHDLERYLVENNSGSIEINSTNLHILLFADDLVLLADTPAGLQKSIQILGDYCSKSNLRINMEKTKVMEFRFQRRKDPSPPYSLYNQITEVTKSYRYLGIILTSNGGLKTAADTLAKQGQKSLFCLLKKASNVSKPTQSLTCHLRRVGREFSTAQNCEYIMVQNFQQFNFAIYSLNRFFTEYHVSKSRFWELCFTSSRTCCHWRKGCNENRIQNR